MMKRFKQVQTITITINRILLGPVQQDGLGVNQMLPIHTIVEAKSRPIYLRQPTSEKMVLYEILDRLAHLRHHHQILSHPHLTWYKDEA